MSAELFSFKLLIHSYSLDKNFYSHIGRNINLPGFAIQLFDFPTFILYSKERLYEDQIGQDKWIKFGNGKSTAFEMSESQIANFMNDRPLIINLINAENSQVSVFSKVIVTLQAFKNDLSQYREKNEENWKRKVFLMFDEAKNQIGKIDLSLSLAKKRKEILNSTLHGQTSNVYQTTNPFKPQTGTNFIRTITEEPKRAGNPSNDLTLKDRPKTEGFSEYDRPSDVVETIDPKRQNYNDMRKISSQSAQDISDRIQTGPPSLKTITEGFYCPPVMMLQKKKKLVRFTDNGGKQETTKSVSFSTATKPRASSAIRSPQYREQSTFNYSANEFNKAAKSISEPQEPAPRPVFVLSNKESEKIVDLFNLKNAKDENFSLVDLLIKELVTLRGTAPQQVTDALAKGESLQIGSLRAKDGQKDNKMIAPLRKGSFGKEGSEKGKENVDDNFFLPLKSPKRGKFDSFRPRKRSFDVANEIIKETYEEANAPEEEYSQDFESMSASQSQPIFVGNQIRRKSDILNSGKLKSALGVDRIESIEESYPDDFDQLSAASGNFSRNQNKFSVKTGGLKDYTDDNISEDIGESSSKIYNSSSYPKNFGKKDIRGESALRESRMSEYSEDFEVLSEDNY